MAVGDVEAPGNGRKRKRKIEKRLLVDEKVEVRSLEDGFLGSWHSGTVISCDNRVRHVKYDHLLLNDGSDFLVDAVSVSAILDDVNSSIGNSNSRGYIRPLPPTIDFGKWGLPYGLCVDVYYQDAWWEGVIFDHEDGSDERRIFFPDLGDELKVGIETLRITQDWDEATADWQRRGTWSFLELIDQCEQEFYLPVSLKQIWYEVRAKKGFLKIGEWTYAVNDLWRELVMEVIGENLDITLKEMVRVLEIPSIVGSELDKASVCSNKNPSVNLVDFDAMAITGESVKNDMMISNIFKKKKMISNYSNQENALSSLVFDAEGISGADSISHHQLPIIKDNNVNKQLKCSGRGNKWEPLSAMIPPDSALYSDAVTEYSLLGSSERPTQTVLENLRKHLLYLGWKIECRQDKSIFKYTSPEGKYFYSLRQVCKLLTESCSEIPPSNHGTRHEKFSSLVLEQTERSSSPNNCLQTRLDGSDVFGKPELLHEAVMDYYNLNQLGSNGSKNMPEMQTKARRHLLSSGWRLLLNDKGGKQRWLYTSPLGRSCASLLTACKIFLDEQKVYNSTESACRPMGSIYLIKDQFVRNKFYSAPSDMDVQECSVPSNSSKTFSGESARISPSKDLVELSNDEFQRTKRLRSMANFFDFSSHFFQSQPKLDGKEYESGIQTTICKKYVRRIKGPRAVKQKFSSGSMSVGINKFSDDMERRRSMRLSRSSKRVHEVATPSPSHHNPRTVLSWLIDNNVVLPRAKVYYCRGKGLRPMAEGRISRDGIKCCCCQKVFTINGFEIHAGGTSSRSAANVLLEDGKSLLECQILCNKKIRNFKREAVDCMKGGYSKGENDYICSICHYGGTLILCDQCPSSFHQSCLGLKDIPHGDWFCPSCCCGICGQNKLNEDTNIVDDPFLTCYQCEHKYHVKCLGIKGIQNFGSYPKTYWFCNKHCEEIHWGLQRLLGKSIPVGDNLTWTLLRATNSDSHHFNPPQIETLTENHSKLNVALSVMHECFEPVREPDTSRDLVEDVIFSRRSELKRLNFQGFYTVLLERNDELVSVAAIRVYGAKVAEIPLVGTRFQYRRHGMCSILMNELEKRLRELGVQRLVLPAVSSVLNAWTTSFGFSRMTDSERLEYIDYTFLDFQETIMCQKFLQKNTVTPSSLTGTCELRDDDVNKTSNSVNNICGSSVITEVHLTTHTEECSIVGRGQVGLSAGNYSDNTPGLEVVDMGKLKNHLQRNTSQIEKFPVCLAEGYKHFEGLQESAHDYLKYYRRRNKVLSC